MTAIGKLLGGTVLGLALLGTLAQPAWADKISAAGKNPPMNTTAPEQPPPPAPPPSVAPPAPPATPAVDFGDDTGQWARDGECDDPRFEGTGVAAELVDEDIRKDATDCQAAYDAGTVTLKDSGTAPSDIAIASPVDAIDWGDDSSEYAKDAECDDPRFTGAGMGPEPLESNMRKDATDCRAAYQAGSVSLKQVPPPPIIAPAEAPTPIDFGDDSGEWARDGECDDPRFQGMGVADELVEADLGKDATDCRTAFDAGSVTLNPNYKGGAGAEAAAIDYGDDTSKWARDGECDDPRFSGTGVAGELVEEDRMHDATDCRAAVEAGTASFNGETALAQPVAQFDFGSDTSKWANDGECDDLRFQGTGVDKKLLPEDLSADASDCRAAVEAGTATIRTVYSPEYAAGAPYDGSSVDFGDNTSDYANDEICDDPRFEGPGAASVLLDDDLKRDSVDCKAAFEAGKIVLRETAEG